MDFSDAPPPAPLFITTWSRYSVGFASRLLNIAPAHSAITWVANQAVYVPFALPWHYPLRRMFWFNSSTVGGTATIGLYTREGANLYRSAATTTVGASLPQYVTVSPDLLLPPGQYYVGIAFSGTTTVASGLAAMTADRGRMIGLLQQSAIPAAGTAATFAAWSSTFLPLCGFTQTASGF